MPPASRCCCGCSIFSDDFAAETLNERYEFDGTDWERTGGAPPDARMTSNGGTPVHFFSGLANVYISFRYSGTVGDTITIRAGTHLEWQIGPAVTSGSHLQFPIYTNGTLSGSYTTVSGTEVAYDFYSALTNDTDDYITLGELRSTEGGASTPLGTCLEFNPDDVNWEWEIEATAGVAIASIEVSKFDETCRVEHCNACTWARAGTAPLNLGVGDLPIASVRWYDAYTYGYWTVPLPSSCLFGNLLPAYNGTGPHFGGVPGGSPVGAGTIECTYGWRLDIAYPGDICSEQATFESLDGPEFDDTSDVKLSGTLEVYVGTLTADGASGSKGDVLVIVKGSIAFEIVTPFNGSSFTISGWANTGKNNSSAGTDKVVWGDFDATVPLKAFAPVATFPDIGSTSGVSIGDLDVSG